MQQKLVFKVRNNRGTIERIAGAFSRPGLRIVEMVFSEKGRGEAAVRVEFEGEKKQLERISLVLQKNLDYAGGA